MVETLLSLAGIVLALWQIQEQRRVRQQSNHRPLPAAGADALSITFGHVRITRREVLIAFLLLGSTALVPIAGLLSVLVGALTVRAGMPEKGWTLITLAVVIGVVATVLWASVLPSPYGPTYDESYGPTYEECMADPNTTLEECQALPDASTDEGFPIPDQTYDECMADPNTTLEECQALPDAPP